MERNIRRKEVRTKVESNQREDTSLQFYVQQEHAKDGCSTVVLKVNWDRMGWDGWICGWSEVCFHLGNLLETQHVGLCCRLICFSR